jgi:hypothetical protein
MNARPPQQQVQKVVVVEGLLLAFADLVPY